MVSVDLPLPSATILARPRLISPRCVLTNFYLVLALVGSNVVFAESVLFSSQFHVVVGSGGVKCVRNILERDCACADGSLRPLSTAYSYRRRVPVCLHRVGVDRVC